MKNPVRGRGPAARRTALALLIAAGAAAGCELENPTVIALDDTNPEYLINYGISFWQTHIEMESLASDELSAGPPSNENYKLVDATGNVALYSFYETNIVRLLFTSREHVRLGMQRAAQTGDEAQMRRGQVWYGWMVIETARRFGDQPIRPGGAVLTQRQQYERAVQEFTEAIAGSGPAADSIRNNALAGLATAQWRLGREPVEAARLQAAIDAAEQVLAAAPAFAFGRPRNYQSATQFNLSRGWTVRPAHFADIPFPMVWNFTDAVGLWLIIAESHLLMGSIGEAREALRANPLLPRNHTRLAGRQPGGAVLTPAEVDAFVDSLDAAGVRFAIDELYRENFYGQGFRNVGPDGGPIWPVPLPPNAF